MKWPLTKLKRLAATVAGGTPSVSEPSHWATGDYGIPWVSIGDMSGRATVSTTTRRVTSAGVSAARLPVGRPGTLLLSMYASLGHTAFLDIRASWNQALLGIHPIGDCEVRFLKYALESLKPHLSEFARSNTQQNLSAEQVGNLELPNLPSGEQRRVADFLDTECSHMALIATTFEELRQRLTERETAYLDLTIDDVATRSATLPLRRFIMGVDQGSSPQCDTEPAGDDEWGVLKVSCLRPGVFIPGENKRLPDGALADRRHEVHPGDLLITRANTPGLVGSTATVPRVRGKLLLSDKLFRVKLTPNLDPRYVALIARGSRIRSLCAAVSNGASQSMANIRFEEIKDWPIPVAEPSEQLRIVDELERHHADADLLRTKIDRQLELLAERRQALITAAVSGEFDVSTARGRGVLD